MPKLPLGLLNASGLPPLASRMIAARAGFTCSRARHPMPPRDHPRSRGVYRQEQGALARDHPRSRRVYRAIKDIADDIRGSSPLAQGLPHVGALGVDRVRIIPARAGFTTALSTSQVASRDHPRSRGVYVIFESRAGAVVGSSPLARGLRGLCYYYV